MKSLSRKAFLRCGAALPLALRALSLKADTPPTPAPRRLVFICNSLGFYQPYFYPKHRGDWSSSPYLKALQLPSKWSLIENLFHPGMETSNHDSEKSFLTGKPHPESAHFVNGISLDQLLVPHMGGHTRFPSLSFSIYDRGWGCSWNERGSAIAPMHDESAIFQTLFGQEDLSTRRQQMEEDQAILKRLKQELNQRSQEGSLGGQRETYIRVMQELENRLRRETFWLQTRKPSVDHQLIQDPDHAFSAKVGNLFDLMRLALQTDSTRIITLSLDWVYGAIRVPGAAGGWHTLSHHGGKESLIHPLSRIEADILRHFNRFLVEMDQVEETGGSLLDHTTVVFGSNFEDASNHTCHRLPVIVAGGGYRHPQHTVLEKPAPLCNLYLELLQRHGMEVGQFGTSDGNMNLLGS